MGVVVAVNLGSASKAMRTGESLARLASVRTTSA
jgi:hypothetical protein